jgi:hypothetical protein
MDSVILEFIVLVRPLENRGKFGDTNNWRVLQYIISPEFGIALPPNSMLCHLPRLYFGTDFGTSFFMLRISSIQLCFIPLQLSDKHRWGRPLAKDLVVRLSLPYTWWLTLNQLDFWSSICHPIFLVFLRFLDKTHVLSTIGKDKFKWYSSNILQQNTNMKVQYP